MLQCQQHLFHTFCTIAMWWLESTSTFLHKCLHVHCIMTSSIIPSPSILNILQYFEMWWGMGGVDSPRKGLTTHIFFFEGGGVGKMVNILMGNSVFRLVPTKPYSSKFGHRMLDSFTCLSSIRKIIMTQIYL